MIPNRAIPFDRIFIPDGDTRVLHDVPLEERLRYSYRRKAMEKMAEWLKKLP
jgi:XTP/dITP diphosphohydrolase